MLHALLRAWAFALAAAFCCGSHAHAAPARYPDIMPLRQVKAGMKGYGLTVFRGTRVERFGVTVVGVVRKGSLLVPGHDMILIRMSGGPMTSRNAYVIRGMSGSPIYINGKVIGAFSQGEPESKEPLGGVTPIEDMLETWDPRLPLTPEAPVPAEGPETAHLALPLDLGGRRIDRVVFNAPPGGPLRSNGTTAVLQPCASALSVSGLSRVGRKRLSEMMAAYNVEVVQGAAGGARPGFKGAPLKAGAAMSMMLVTGDITMGSTGTVTYRRGNRILGFGHPFMGIGPIQAPLCSAYVYDVYPLLSGSYKISSPGPVVGASAQDRNFAISGELGRKPRTIAVTVRARDLTTGRARTFRAQVVPHLNLYAGLVSATVASAVAEIRSVPGDAMASVTTTVDADEVGKVTRTNTLFDAVSIADAVTADLDDLLAVLTRNPFYRVGIKSADVRVELRTARRTATLERVFLKEGRYEPGETAEVGLVLKPYRQPEQVRTMALRIPPGTPTGRYALQVRGGYGGGPVSVAGLVFRPSAPQNPDQAPPASTRQMVRRYAERERNNEVAVRLLLNSTSVSANGEVLRGLPPHIDALWRSTRTTGVRLERSEVKVVQALPWVVAGQQALTLQVQRRETQETPAPATGGPAPPSGTPPPSLAPPPGSAAAEMDDVDFAMAAGPGDPPSRGTAPTGQAGPQAPGAQTREADKPVAQPAAPVPPTPPAAPAEEKPVARAASVWRQSTHAEFARGHTRGVGVTSSGELVLARSPRRLAGTAEGFIWCLAPDGAGGVYAGTGPRGRIIRVAAGGEVTTVADLPEVSVHALLANADGSLWAATSPHGRVYRVQPGGKAEVALQAEQPHGLALARGADGAVYAGFGGGEGAIYRIGPDGKAAPLAKAVERHVLALAPDPAGGVYAGTGEAGVVYRVSAQGARTALYDASEASITGVAAAPGGGLYAVTAPRGLLYRIDAEGRGTVVYDRAGAPFTAVQVAADGAVYAAAGSSIFVLGPNDVVAPLAGMPDVEVAALATDAAGRLYAGTANAGEVYAADAPAGKLAGVYESVVHDTRDTSRWGAVSWSAAVPPGAAVQIETRSGASAEPDATWSPWHAVRQTAGGAQVVSPPSRFLQYRIALESDAAGKTPVVRSVAFTYLPRNQAPKVAFTAPTAGDRWSRKQAVRWTGSDPDKDTLSYEVLYSADGGATWLPLPAGETASAPAPAAQPKPPAPTTTVTVTVGAPGQPPTVADVEAELAKHPDLPDELRAAVLARARQVNAARAAEPPKPAAAPTRETTRTLDTTRLPDGAYLLKVTATDRPSNPTDPATASAVSEPVVICNAPPDFYLLQSATRVAPDGTVTLEGVARQALVPVGSVQFRVDGKEWLAAAPADGLYDSGTEAFRVVTGPLPPGDHVVEVKAFSAAGVSAEQKTTVTVRAPGG